MVVRNVFTFRWAYVKHYGKLKFIFTRSTATGPTANAFSCFLAPLPDSAKSVQTISAIREKEIKVGYLL